MPELTTRELSARLGIQKADLLKLCRRYRHSLEIRYGPRGSYLWSEQAAEVARSLLEPGNPRFKIERTKEAETYEGTLHVLRRNILESKRLAETLEAVYSNLAANPPAVTGFIYTLPHPGYQLASPLGVIIAAAGKGKFRATLVEANLWAEGPTQPAALLELRTELLMGYLLHAKQPKKDPERWQVFQQLVVPRQKKDHSGARRRNKVRRNARQSATP